MSRMPKTDSMYTVPQLTDYSAQALEAAALASDSDYKIFRDRWLARKDGIATRINDLWLKAAPKEAKRDAGQLVNGLKHTIEAAIDETLTRLKSHGAATRLAAERLDVTLPGV